MHGVQNFWNPTCIHIITHRHTMTKKLTGHGKKQSGNPYFTSITVVKRSDF
jgi:hypothetical protein